MILDAQTLFSGVINADGTRTPQAITATAVSTNTLDRAGNTVSFPTLEDEGLSGPELYFVCTVVAAFNNLTSLQVELISDSNANLTTAPVSHFSKTILLAGLTAATQVVRVQVPSDDYKRFVGARYTVVGTAPTAGSVFAFFATDVQRNVIYPTGFSIDV